MSELAAILLYFTCLFGYVIYKRKRTITQKEFVIGNRSMNPWTTAMAAHASDMSNWLFMAYPGMVYLTGGQHLWVAIGLILMMWLNWVLVAPKVRRETEKSEAVTITGFYEKRLGVDWAAGRLITSLSLFVFYTIYVAGALFGMGLLMETLFPISYEWGVAIGVAIILPYILIGGYLTLAQVDLFQGLFLLLVLLIAPTIILFDLGSLSNTLNAITSSGKSLSLFNPESPWSLWKSILLMFGWGLGYFGQPHILSKFMGIRDPKTIRISQRVGLTWQVLSFLGASLVGFIGIAVFGTTLPNHEEVFITLMRSYFPPFLAGLFLCAIIAAIINAVSSMLLVLSTTLSEDLYRRFINPEASDKKVLFMMRASSLLSAFLAMSIALVKIGTIDKLVQYSWSGLGATFGPLMIMSLYAKSLTPRGAYAGMLTGALIVLLWPLASLPDVPALTIAFPCALLTIHLGSRVRKSSKPALG